MRSMLVTAVLLALPLSLCAKDIHIDGYDHEVSCRVGDRLCMHFFNDADVKENDATFLEQGSPWTRLVDDGTIYFFVAREPVEELPVRLCSPLGCMRVRVHIRDRLRR